MTPDAIAKTLAECRDFLRYTVMSRVAVSVSLLGDIDAAIRALKAVPTSQLGMTSLMVSPEAIDECLVSHVDDDVFHGDNRGENGCAGISVHAVPDREPEAPKAPEQPATIPAAVVEQMAEALAELFASAGDDPPLLTIRTRQDYLANACPFCQADDADSSNLTHSPSCGWFSARAALAAYEAAKKETDHD